MPKTQQNGPKPINPLKMLVKQHNKIVEEREKTIKRLREIDAAISAMKTGAIQGKTLTPSAEPAKT